MKITKAKSGSEPATPRMIKVEARLARCRREQAIVALVLRWIPPIVTASFVMAGYVKETGILERLPFDLTLALALLTALLVAVRLATSAVPRQIHGVVLAFALLIPPVAYSATTAYGTDKIGRLFAFTFLSALAPVALIRDDGDIARFVWALTGMGSVVVATALANPQPSSDYEGAPIQTDSAGTIGLGSAAGLVVVVLILGLIWNRISRLAVIPAAAAVYVLLQSGSRGPLVSAVVAVLVGSLLTRVRPGFGRIAVFGALLSAGVLVAYSVAPAASQSRIAALLEGDTTGSVDVRIKLYQDATESILRHPLGIGWGNYEGIAFGGYTYPHNLPLEVMAEAGLIFGGLFLLWICHVVIRARQITVDFTGAAVFAVVLFWMSAALVSGDINDHRDLFYALGVAVAASAARAPGDGVTAHPNVTSQGVSLWIMLPGVASRVWRSGRHGWRRWVGVRGCGR